MTKRKILILSSSPRRNSNSDLLSDQFAQGAQEAGHEVVKIRLKDKQIDYCSGCGACAAGKSCTLDDDMKLVLQQIIDSDVIVMATPVYFYTMSAQMKTLIDRTCARFGEISNKQFYFLMTAADPDLKTLDPTLQGFRAFLSCLTNPTEAGVLKVGGVYKQGEVKKHPAWRQAFEQGRNVQ